MSEFWVRELLLQYWTIFHSVLYSIREKIDLDSNLWFLKFVPNNLRFSVIIDWRTKFCPLRQFQNTFILSMPTQLLSWWDSLLWEVHFSATFKFGGIQFISWWKKELQTKKNVVVVYSKFSTYLNLKMLIFFECLRNLNILPLDCLILVNLVSWWLYTLFLLQSILVSFFEAKICLNILYQRKILDL